MNRSFQSFGKENVGKFTIANFSYFSNLGKILANDVHFAKLTKIFSHQNLHDTIATYFCSGIMPTSVCSDIIMTTDC